MAEESSPLVPDPLHAKILGYRALTEEEIGILNLSKAREHEIAVLMAQVQTLVGSDPSAGRWLAISRTHLETAMMFLNKAITRPSGGLGGR